MRTIIQAVGVVVLVSLLAIPRPASATVQDDVTSITKSALQATLGLTNVQVNYVSVIGQWGFTSWTVGEGGGDTIMEQINGTWNVLAMGHGQMNATLLTQGVGVPQDIAVALMYGSCPPLKRHVNRQPLSMSVRRIDKHGKRIDSIIRCPH
jgi:hypothetical protein